MNEYINILFNTVNDWVIFGIILIIAELFISNIGFLFTGLSAFTIALFSSLNIIEPNKYYNIYYFLILSILYWLLLWTRIKKLLKSKQGNLNNIIGDNGVVIDKDLLPNVIGKVKWSGTIFNAKIFEEQNDIIETGSIVEIVKIEGNILFVKKFLIVYN